MHVEGIPLHPIADLRLFSEKKYYSIFPSKSPTIVGWSIMAVKPPLDVRDVHVLQCVAGCCSILQRVAACCSVLQCAVLR